MQKDQLPKKNIREIQPNPFLVQKRLGKKLRVAAYCRVSTAQEEQELSFESQVAYYTNLIENNPEWELVEIFADHGISGTKDTTRPGFMSTSIFSAIGKGRTAGRKSPRSRQRR